MNEAIAEYRERRAKRLAGRNMQKDADGEISWITVKNGEHVPLEGGKAVGGPLKGKDFSGAKSAKREVKGTATPTKKLSTALKKANSVESIQSALKKAENGAKVYMIIGDRVVGYKKNGMEYRDWHSIYGAPIFSDAPHHAFPDQDYIRSETLAAYMHNYPKFTSLREAKKVVSETFPRRTEKGQLKEIASIHGHSRTWLSHEVQKKIEADKEVKNSAAGTGTFAVYSKSVSKTKEINDAAEKDGLNYYLKRALKKQGVEGYQNEPVLSRGGKGGNELFATVKYKESHGRGKKATYREERYKVDVYGERNSFVNSKGELIAEEVHIDGMAIKLKRVA